MDTPPCKAAFTHHWNQIKEQVHDGGYMKAGDGAVPRGYDVYIAQKGEMPEIPSFTVYDNQPHCFKFLTMIFLSWELTDHPSHAALLAAWNQETRRDELYTLALGVSASASGSQSDRGSGIARGGGHLQSQV